MSELNLDTLEDDLWEAYNPNHAWLMSRESHAHLQFLYDHGKYSKKKRQLKKNMTKCTRMFEELWAKSPTV